MSAILLWAAIQATAPGAAVGSPAVARDSENPVGQLRVSTDFDGGSARVLSIDQDGARIRFGLAGDPRRGWPCWWCFRLSGIRPGQTITLELTADKVPSLGNFDPLAWNPQRPALSVDGRTWRQFEGKGRREGRTFTWQTKIDARQAWFAWGPPFTATDATTLVERIAASSPHARRFELCRSREGRPVPGLVIEEKTSNASPRYGVWVEARQHAWELGASWACRGLVEWLVSSDPRAQSLRRKCRFEVVPIMDIDNVATGNGGKNQPPHDHNRDWSEQPHWPEVRAAQERIRVLARAGRMDMFIDLHDPEAGAREAFYFFPEPSIVSPRQVRNHDRLMKESVAEIVAPISVQSKLRSTGPKYDPKMWQWISKNWVVRNTPDHVVAVTLEIAWNTPGCTSEGYMTLGRQLGLALERYFREDPRK
jgi:hypothetical protein